ncbi:hypothetical protein ACFWN2_10030 [Lentzea sp. NPDC058436]|uniref:hypothetical protein n=1 Tax=Lentzea sp. NPDC058436 TaxID=3346499 RepID=UPI00364F645B
MRALFGLALLLVAGCTVAVPGTAHREALAARVSPAQSATVTANSHLAVTVPEGAVGTDATLSVRPSPVALLERPGFVGAGEPVEITVDAPLRKPAALTFDGQGGPEGGLPVLLRHDPAAGWYPIEVGEPGKPLVARRTELSTHLAGWLTASASWVPRRFAGKHEPPRCGPKPDWAQLTEPKDDLVTACVGAEGEQAVLTVRNNRTFPVDVAVPKGVEPSVKDQADPLRRFLGAEHVLLFGGQELTLRWPRPSQSGSSAVVPRFTVAAHLTHMVAVLLGVEDLRGQAALAVFVHRCKKVVDARESAAGLGALRECAEPLADEARARAAATSIAQTSGLPEDAVVDMLRVMGSVLTFYTPLKLPTDRVPEGPDANRSVVVRLTGTEPPPLDPAFVGTWSQHAGGLEIRASRTGRVSYQVQSAGLPEFYAADLKFEVDGPKALKATVTSTNDPGKPKGTVLTLRLEHPGIMITGLRQENSRWCNAVTRQNGECGA